MADEERGFAVKVLEWQWIPSRELGGGRNPRPPTRGAPKRIEARCLACGHVWKPPKRRDPTKGCFALTPSHVHLWCPECGREGQVLLQNP